MKKVANAELLWSLYNVYKQICFLYSPAETSVITPSFDYSTSLSPQDIQTPDQKLQFFQFFHFWKTPGK